MDRGSNLKCWGLRAGAVALFSISAFGTVERANAMAAAPTTPFVAATGGVWTGPGVAVVPETTTINSTGPVVVETGSLPTAYGKFRSAFGSNGFDIQVTGGIDREVDGGSVWSDAFTVTGGTGSGSLLMSSHVVGTVSGAGEMAYALFVSSDPFDFNAIAARIQAADAFGAVQLLGASRVGYTAIANGCGGLGESRDCAYATYKNFQGAFDTTVAVAVPFTYGQALYVTSLFAGGVGVVGGTASFYNSASFGISVPSGSTLQTLSGATYIAAVPEPSMVWMFVAGLGLVSFLVGRSRGRNPD